MNIEELRTYCLSKKGTSEDFPFDETTLCFRVMEKIFIITDTEKLPFTYNAKCDPEEAVDLRERYEAVKPGYHMNKKHWNTIEANSDLDDHKCYELIDHSYDLVVKGLTKAEKELLKSL